MNSYDYELDDDFSPFPVLPDDLTDEDLEMMEYLADLHDLEQSVPTAAERNQK